eukprot:scaffold33336_cov66-Phaeocystis_antarctica.AAC.1
MKKQSSLCRNHMMDKHVSGISRIMSKTNAPPPPPHAPTDFEPRTRPLLGTTTWTPPRQNDAPSGSVPVPCRTPLPVYALDQYFPVPGPGSMPRHIPRRVFTHRTPPSRPHLHRTALHRLPPAAARGGQRCC